MRLLVLILLAAPLYIVAQPYPQNYFRSPLDIELLLSGNFAEIRPNHFHGGVDFKTQGAEGKNIYAVADGYVSRISISPTGYGKAIYIDHPNGYTTVYGHLKRLNKKIEEFTHKEQYRQKKFKINIYPKKGELPVKKGEVIALSGNSGSSGGPHLHFEVRDTESEHPHNPLLFGFPVKDTSRPVIFNLYAYPLNEAASINGRNRRHRFQVVGANGKYRLAEPILLKGKVGFGLQAHDYLDGTRNRCGVYSIAMLIDGKPNFSMKMNEHGFDETRYINAHIDFSARQQHRSKIHKTYIMPNNKLSIYDRKIGDGTFKFSDKHTVEFSVFDANGNKSTLKFETQKAQLAVMNKGEMQGELFKYDRANYVIEDDIRIIFPMNSFYDDVQFRYSSSDKTSGTYSKIYQIHNHLVPVHARYHLSILPENLPENLKDKALIVRIDERGRKRAYSSNWINGFLNTKAKHFGKFCIVTDTTSPTIQPLRSATNGRVRWNSSISFRISDNLSGIDEITPTIDGEWALYDWDPKRRLLTIELAKHCVQKSEIQFNLELKDWAGNRTVFKKLYRIF